MGMKKSIWELDVLRGLCILGMVVVHLMYDLVELYGLIEWEYPPLFSFIMNWGGVLFLLIAAILLRYFSPKQRRIRKAKQMRRVYTGARRNQTKRKGLR